MSPPIKLDDAQQRSVDALFKVEDAKIKTLGEQVHALYMIGTGLGIVYLAGRYLFKSRRREDE